MLLLSIIQEIEDCCNGCQWQINLFIFSKNYSLIEIKKYFYFSIQKFIFYRDSICFWSKVRV